MRTTVGIPIDIARVRDDAANDTCATTISLQGRFAYAICSVQTGLFRAIGILAPRSSIFIAAYVAWVWFYALDWTRPACLEVQAQTFATVCVYTCLG